jgi:hypothetical protein
MRTPKTKQEQQVHALRVMVKLDRDLRGSEVDLPSVRGAIHDIVSDILKDVGPENIADLLLLSVR